MRQQLDKSIKCWNETKAKLIDNSINTFDLTMTLWNNHSVACAFAHYIVDDLKLEVNDKSVAIQWLPVFLQAIAKQCSLKDALENYEYPHDMPNLTKDRTNEFEIRDHSIYHNGYNEDVRLVYFFKQADDEFKANNNFVVINKARILKFD